MSPLQLTESQLINRPLNRGNSTCDEDQEAFEEYAAIMQYDGGITREEAEARACEDVRPRPKGDRK